MAENSIAKAYVQIVPSAEGIKGKLTSLLSGEAESAGTSSGKTIGNGLVSGVKNAAAKVGSAFVTVAKAGAAGLAAGTAGIAAFSKSALDAYADYEQLVGGVETLFGESASTVMAYADNAFQSAGLSANDYMETVTSFSASLLQSVNNDTAKAAEYANEALVDMSDNANKMGTNMQDIQNAYQGFAKQNYTMLDNLKLGYGGTKEEMERLIEDANKLKKANGETADLSIDSFADVVEAIHLVQTEMGITGTTAEEASTTIQGSVSMMKASWENLLVGVADDSQDFDGLMNNFVTSAATAASNILPRIETILSGTGELISGIAPIIAAAVPVLVETVLPEMISAGVSLVSALAEAIVANAPALLQAAMDSIALILNQGLGLSEDTSNGIMGVLQSLLDGCSQIFSAIGEAASSIGDTITEALDNLGISWGDAWNGISSGISAAAGVISTVIAGIAETISWLVDEANTDGTLINTLWTNLATNFTTLVDTLSAIFGAFVSLFSGDLDGFLSGMSEGIGSALSGVQTIFSTSWGFISSTVSSITSAIGSYLSNKWAAIKTDASSAWAGIKSAIGDKINNIKTDVSDKFTSIKTTISDKLKAAKATVTSIFTSIKTTISDKIQAAKDAVHNAIEAIKEKFNFSWSLPKLKLPHISISGSFSIVPPSAPSFSISWYKKAMGNAVVLDGATIFGSMGGNFLGGGEAGREVVAGETHLLDLMSSAVHGELSGSASALEAKLDRLIALLARMAGVTINVNGADYQSRKELAEAIMELLERDYERQEAAL